MTNGVGCSGVKSALLCVCVKLGVPVDVQDPVGMRAFEPVR
jgi:hypothetical protein